RSAATAAARDLHAPALAGAEDTLRRPVSRTHVAGTTRAPSRAIARDAAEVVGPVTAFGSRMAPGGLRRRPARVLVGRGCLLGRLAPLRMLVAARRGRRRRLGERRARR